MFALLYGAILLVVVAATIRWPTLRAEDGWIEGTGAFGFLAAAAVFASACLRTFRNTRYGITLVQATTGGLCLVLFLSEISFGARLFGWAMPQMKGGGEFDGAHDVAIMAVRRWQDAGLDRSEVLVPVAFCIGGLCFLGLLTFRRRLAAWARYVLRDLTALHLAAVALALACAVLLDLAPERYVRARIVEEALEFVAACILLTCAIRMFADAGRLGRKATARRTPGRERRPASVMPAE